MTAPRPVAIVGFSCRVPSGPDYESLWKLLSEGRIVTGAPPVSRRFHSVVWNDAALSGLDEASLAGGYLEEVDLFDDQLFQMSPREAKSVDPQHRLLMEESWRALQDAGFDPHRPGAKSVGVFMGLCSFDYALLGHEVGMRAGPYTAIGGALCLGANRISHAFGFNGPSMTIDAACASSLVATHLAVQAIQSGECDLALAGGANLVLTPSVTTSFRAAKMLARSGRCRTFDKDADGYVRSEAVGVVVLKGLSEALDDGDPIHAIVEAGTVNQDGHTRGITVPSTQTQETLIRQCWEKAGLSADDPAFIEAHGTGTPTGDPVEIEALSRALSERTPNIEPCYVGSLKANLGHAEAAAGVLAIIKAALALERRMLPPHVGATRALDALNKEEGRLRLAKQPVALSSPDLEKPVYAGVSAFGFGGTNCHLLLRSPPAQKFSKLAGPMAVTLSAHSPAALRTLCDCWAEYLDSATHQQAAAAGRFSMRAYSGERFRALAIADEPASLATQLRADHPHEENSVAEQIRLRLRASSATDLLSDEARARIKLERVQTSRDEAETLVRSEIRALLEQLFPQSDHDARKDVVHEDEIMLTQAQGVPASDVIVVDATRAKTLPALLELWRKGLAVNAASLAPGILSRPEKLPGYRFTRRSHWHAHLQSTRPQTDSAQTCLLRFDQPYLAQHLISGEAVVPGASIVLAVLDEARARLGSDIEAHEICFENALLLKQAAKGVLLNFSQHKGGEFAFELYSALPNRSGRIRHAFGIIRSNEVAACSSA